MSAPSFTLYTTTNTTITTVTTEFHSTLIFQCNYKKTSVKFLNSLFIVRIIAAIYCTCWKHGFVSM